MQPVPIFDLSCLDELYGKKVLFHGSQKFNDILKPQKPICGEQQLNKRGVYATDQIQIALFKAILKKKHAIPSVPLIYSWYLNKGTWKFGVNLEYLNQVPFYNGFLYVLSPSNFKPLPFPNEWVSTLNELPFKTYQVKPETVLPLLNIQALPNKYLSIIYSNLKSTIAI